MNGLAGRNRYIRFDKVVGGIGFEPMASSVSTKRSPPDLTAQVYRGCVRHISDESYYTTARKVVKLTS